MACEHFHFQHREEREEGHRDDDGVTFSISVCLDIQTARPSHAPHMQPARHRQRRRRSSSTTSLPVITEVEAEEIPARGEVVVPEARLAVLDDPKQHLQLLVQRIFHRFTLQRIRRTLNFQLRLYLQLFQEPVYRLTHNHRLVRHNLHLDTHL